MNRLIALLILVAGAGVVVPGSHGDESHKSTSPTASVKLLHQALDPFGYPRPAPDSKDVPVRTSIYFEIGVENPQPGDLVSKSTLAVTLEAAGQNPIQVLSPGERFEPGFSGRVQEVGRRMMGDGPSVTVYIEPAQPLNPLTTYTVQVTASSVQGATMASDGGRWNFTTAPQLEKHSLAFNLDLGDPPVRWQGYFFSGFCKVGFCDSPRGLESSYEMMARDRVRFPRAWVLKRDFWLTGMDHTPNRLGRSSLPNIVRELETRRIAAITSDSQGYLLQVEDFFGHEQYGIPSGRPLSGDYQEGFEILIADGKSHARARVIAVDDEAGTVLVGRFEMPAGGFTFDDPSGYASHLGGPVPGRFPDGGCYLRRFAPAGTPRYYWGRLDHEWDISRRYGQRVMVNFADAPGDLSDKGQNWCPPKDYAQLHEVTRAITDHVIERYGVEASLGFTWSIFNEPDLGSHFWHGTLDDIYKFYDYSTDAILRAFEDHGVDSDKVFIGGLELGAVFPNLAMLDEFLRHCSPGGTAKTSLNAAYADSRLDGKRSRRVESLCRANGGKGSPVDFISIHTYNRSAVAAGKLKLAKDKALAIDPVHYEKLWICSHESTPDWIPKPDPAFSEVYLGNGYYSTWCADVAWRQLSQAAKDPRYAAGNTILTFWPWPVGLGGLGAPTQTARVDDDGDGQKDRDAILRAPIYNFLNMLGSLGENYWVLPEQNVAGHTVTGFASRGPRNELRVLLYAHDAADVQVRSDLELEIQLSLGGLSNRAVRAKQYRFDRNHHSYFDLARKIIERPGRPALTKEELRELEKQYGHEAVARFGRITQPMLSASELAALEQQVALKPDEIEDARFDDDGRLVVPAAVAGNGATFLVIEDKK